MDLTRKEQPFVSTGVYTPERAEALRQAAAEGTGAIAVSVLDPSNAEEADRFATASASKEKARYASNYNLEIGAPSKPRTLEEIKDQVIAPAHRAGKVLVLVETSQNDLGDFWRRANAIIASSEK